MTAMRSRPKPLPQRCPVCDDKRQDAGSITLHNQIAASTGCRIYGTK